MPNIPQGELPVPKSWDEFEDIVWDLYARLWDDPGAQRYGRSGEPQQGVDSYGQPAHLDGAYAGIQCKRYGEGKLTRAVIRAEVAKAEDFDPPLAQYTIATTDPRTAELQAFVRQYNKQRLDQDKKAFAVQIVTWEDLSSQLAHPDNRDLLEKHYGEWLNRSLGVGPGPQPKVDRATVAEYLKVMRTQCGRVETRPYHTLSELRGAPPRLSLLDEEDSDGVYVPLRFDVQLRRDHPQVRQVTELFSEERFEPRSSAPDLAASDTVWPEEMTLDTKLRGVLEATRHDSTGHVVFIGAAGSGKTTVLRVMAAVLAQQDPALARDKLGIEPGSDPLPLPVYLALRDFEHACQTSPRIYRRDVESLLRFLDDHFQHWHPGKVPPGFVSGLVQAGRAWLLLDALDEVADFDHRLDVRRVIEGLAGAFPETRLLITARVAAYANARLDERFHVASVRDLTRKQWAPLVERLYSGLEEDAGVAAERTRRLLARVDASPALQEMVKTPLMVWTATLIHFAERELPEQRAELYNAYVDVLLGERLHVEESAEATQSLQGRWSVDERRLYLSYAAWQVHQGAEAERAGRRREALVVVDEQDVVRQILAPFMAEEMMLEGNARQVRRRSEAEAREFLAFMAERSGLLEAHPEGVSFGDHLTVQEFLSANYLADNVLGGERREFLRERAGQSWWLEVVLLMAGYLLQSPQQLRRFLLDELGKLPSAGAETGAGDARAYGLAWAGRALLEIPPRRVSWHAGASDELARRLVGVLWQNPPVTSVAARVEAGGVLGQLGDPRFSGSYRLPEFISIPAGRFWMGSDEAEVEELVRITEGEWPKRELPRHQVELDAFGLARYPTTNAMYARFMEAGGYSEEQWWPEARDAGAWQPEGKVVDLLGDSRDRPRYWDDAGLNGPNQPVVGITWYEAAAYCHWLTAALDDGHEYHLPIEAQWERAARGPSPHEGGNPAAKASRYPWGEEWAEGRANSAELGLERSTPVGLFPNGASAEGVLDLSGNVWEWCTDWHGEDTYHRRAERITHNPDGPNQGRYKIVRGGSWYDEKNIVRCAYRNNYPPGGWHYDFGFRVARGPLG